MRKYLNVGLKIDQTGRYQNGICFLMQQTENNKADAEMYLSYLLGKG